MKKSVNIILIFTFGLILGCVVTSIIFGKINQRRFAENYSRGLIEQTYLAKSLHLKKHEELLKDIEAKLPAYVLAIHENPDLLTAPDGRLALQSVRDFYECSKKKVPDKISKILAALPSSPVSACEIKR